MVETRPVDLRDVARGWVFVVWDTRSGPEANKLSRDISLTLGDGTTY